jgi:hypothetical protein
VVVATRKYGIYREGKYKGSVNGVHTREKEYWTKMLARAYPGKTWEKRPTYVGCSCTSLFNEFQLFAEWCNTQVGFGNESWHLDKDLLVKGNKVYGEHTCVFLPPEINNMLVTRKDERGAYPIGVTMRCKKTPRFIAQCNNGTGKPQVLGFFDTPEEAHLAYKCFKEAHVKSVAEKYKNLLDVRAYSALLNFTVEITD